MILLTPIFMTKLLQIVVTVFMVGQPPIVERLPELYSNNSGRCERRVEELKSMLLDDVKATIECEETDDRQG